MRQTKLPRQTIAEKFMKKTISCFLACLLIIALALPAFAAGVTVSAQDAAISTEQTSLISVDISGNTGIMGFKIVVKYDVKKVDIVSVTKGDRASKGNFISNFGTNDGAFNVVWNNTSQIKEDGSLFVIGVKAKENFDASKIELSYSQGDTFNEKYEDVKLNCEDITVTCKKGEEPSPQPEPEPATKADTKEKAKVEQPSAAQIKDAINVALNDSGYQKIADVEKTDTDFVKKVNDNMKKMTGNEDTYAHINEIQRAYNAATESEFLEIVNNSSAEPQAIKEAIEKAMVDCSITSLDDIDEKTLPKFLKEVEKNLQALDKEIPSLTDSLDDATALKIIKKLYGSLELTESKTDVEKEVAQKQQNQKTVWIVVIVVIALAIAATAAVLIWKKKKKKQKTEKAE